VAVQAGLIAEVPVPEHGDLEGLKGLGEAARTPEPVLAAPVAAAASDLTAAPAGEPKKSGKSSTLLIVGLTVLGAAAAIVGGYLAVNAANAAPVGTPQVHWSTH
jgi:hypothetical protein